MALQTSSANEEVRMTAQGVVNAVKAMEATMEDSRHRTNRAGLFARLGADADIALKNERLEATIGEAEPTEDPIMAFRQLLEAGQVLLHYEAGKAANKHFMTSSDYKAFTLKETSKKARTLSSKRFAISKVKAVVAGHGRDHLKKQMIGQPKPVLEKDCAFYLTGFRDEELLCLGANTADNATQWVAALQITIKVAHKWPQWLARPKS